MSIRYLFLLGILIFVELSFPAAVLANGGEHKFVILEANVAFSDSGKCSLRCVIAPILFRITAFKSKYRVLQISIKNTGKVTLPMSVADDALTLIYDQSEVEAVLNLPAHESNLWSELPLELRTNLAYPTDVPPHEEHTVFAFVPTEAPASPPARLGFKLSGIPGPTVELFQLGATAD